MYYNKLLDKIINDDINNNNNSSIFVYFILLNISYVRVIHKYNNVLHL